MPVPSTIDDLSTTPGSNSPAGSETPSEGDNYLRTYGAFIALLRDKLDGTSATGEINDATFSGTMAGAATWSELQTFAAGIAGTTGTFSGAVSGTTGTFSGALSGSNVLSSTYTPTIVATTNVTGTPAATSAFHYMRVGNEVAVSGTVTIDPTSASTYTEIGIPLPIASDLIGGNCAGTACQAQGTGIGTAGFVGGDTINDRAMLGFISHGTDVASRNWTFHFLYTIV